MGLLHVVALPKWVYCMLMLTKICLLHVVALLCSWSRRKYRKPVQPCKVSFFTWLFIFKLFQYQKVGLLTRTNILSMRGSRGGGQGVRTPLKNHKNIGFPSNTGQDPLKKSQSYQDSVQCWAIATDDGPLIVVFGSSLPSST